MNVRGYQQYKKQSVDTMTKGELLILLYDEAIKRLFIAEKALKEDDMATFDAAIERVTQIVRYLIDSLDRKYEIATQLYRLYDYFMYMLWRLRASRKVEFISELREHFVELRDAFKEADRIQNGK